MSVESLASRLQNSPDVLGDDESAEGDQAQQAKPQRRKKPGSGGRTFHAAVTINDAGVITITPNGSTS